MDKRASAIWRLSPGVRPSLAGRKTKMAPRAMSRRITPQAIKTNLRARFMASSQMAQFEATYWPSARQDKYPYALMVVGVRISPSPIKAASIAAKARVVLPAKPLLLGVRTIVSRSQRREVEGEDN